MGTTRRTARITQDVPTPPPRYFIVHHNPDRGGYSYDADPTDAVASAKALLDAGPSSWVAGNCRRLLKPGSVVLFLFGGRRLRQMPGVYLAAQVTQQPSRSGDGRWRFTFRALPSPTRVLLREPLSLDEVRKLVGRSYGASIQQVPDEAVPRLERRVPSLKKRPPLEITAPTHGLVIHKEPLDLILAGRKTWEIRGRATQLRGPIALIEGGTGLIVGTCDVIDVVGPLSLRALQKKGAEWGWRPTSLYYPETYAWVLSDAQRLEKPVRYRHPSGAVIWVRLSAAERQRLRDAIAARLGV